MRTVRITLKDGQACLLDADIAQELKDASFYLSPNGYVLFYKNRQLALVHRYVMKASQGEVVDHQYDDKLDNRRQHLRVTTTSANCANRHSTCSNSGYRCVYVRPKRRKKYEIKIKRKEQTLWERFYSVHVAGLMVDVVLKRLWDWPGYMNFPLDVPESELKNLIRSSMGTWMTMIFSKKTDGSCRVLTCRTMYSEECPPPASWKHNHNDLYFVQDKDGGIKAVPLRRILCLIVNHMRYRVTRPRHTMRGRTPGATSSVRPATP